MKPVIILIIGVCLIWMYTPTAAEEIRVAVIHSPLLTTEQEVEGFGRGIIYDLLSEAGRLAGVNVVFVFFPLQRAYTNFVKDKIAFTIGHPVYYQMFFGAEPEAFETIPILKTQIHLYYYKSTFPNGFEFESVNDWKGYKVGTMRGNPFLDVYRKAGIDLHLFDTFKSGIWMLKLNRIQLLELPAVTGRYMMQVEFKDEQDDFGVASKSTFSQVNGLVYKAANKKAGLIAQKISQALSRMKDNGTYQKILTHYWGDDTLKLMP